MKILKGRIILFITVIMLSFGNAAYSVSGVSNLRVPLDSRRADEILRQAADRSPTNVQDASVLSAVFDRFIEEIENRLLLNRSYKIQVESWSEISLDGDSVTIHCHSFIGSAITNKFTTVRKTPDGNIEVTITETKNSTLYGILNSSSTLRFLPEAIEYVSYDPEIWKPSRSASTKAITIMYCKVPAPSLKDIKFIEKEFRVSFILNNYEIPKRIENFFRFINEWGEAGDIKFEYSTEKNGATHKPTGLSYFILAVPSPRDVENSAEITCSPQQARVFLKAMAESFDTKLEEGAIESFISGGLQNVLQMGPEDRYSFQLTQDGILLEYNFKGIKPNDRKAAAEQAFSIFQTAFARAVNESNLLSTVIPNNLVLPNISL